MVEEMVSGLKSDLTDYADISEESIDVISLFDVEEMYEYKEVYSRAFDQMKDLLRDGFDVYVNVSSMPRTVVFGYSAAVTSLISQLNGDEVVGDPHLYYVVPEEYYAPTMFNHLDRTHLDLERMQHDVGRISDKLDEGKVNVAAEELSELQERLSGVVEGTVDLIDDIDRFGITKGAKKPVEFPAFRHPNIRVGEKVVLYTLKEEGASESITDLANKMAGLIQREFEEDMSKETLRGMVQHNLSKLVEKGFVSQEKKGKGHRSELSDMGELWVEVHTDDLSSAVREYLDKK